MGTRRKGWIRPIAFDLMPANEGGEGFTPPFLYWRVKDWAMPYIRGALAFWYEKEAWEGTEEEKEHITQALIELGMSPTLNLEEILTACPWYGANFRLNEAGELEAQQGLNLPPPPWEFRLTQGEAGANLEFRTVP